MKQWYSLYVFIILILLYLFAAIQAEVVGRETLDDWVKFTVNINTVYKRRQQRINRGEEIMWVPVQDLTCKCPKVRLHRRYLIVSEDKTSGSRSGLVLDNRSIVIPWKDKWQKRLRKFQREERKGRC